MVHSDIVHTDRADDTPTTRALKARTRRKHPPAGMPVSAARTNLIDSRPGCDLRPFRENESLAARGLRFTPEIEAETAAIHAKLRHIVTPMEWPAFAPLISAIKRLKREKNAIILAHNYMTPEIYHGVADVVGDSLKLAQMARETAAPVIVQAGVHFMAETAKILNPDRKVLIPDLRAGCSLAASITGADVRRIRAEYPGLPIVTYVNTSAEVKAESDICCTSSNAVTIVEWIAKEWGVDQVIVIPDEYLAKNIAAQTDVKIIAWRGACEVHERFTAADIAELRAAFPGAIVLAHPECPPETAQAADFVGSTAALAHYAAEHRPARAVLLTECSMSDNVAASSPSTLFVRPCNLCPHMKRISLENVHDALVHDQYAVELEPALGLRARKAIEAMLAVPQPAIPPSFDPAAPAKSVPVISYKARGHGIIP